MSEIKPEVGFEAFTALDIRAGVVARAEPFPEARKPSLKLWIDFGPELGERRSSAQLTRRYTGDDLVGTTVLAVLNLGTRRIAGFESQVLVLGVLDPNEPGDVVLVRPDAGGDPGTAPDVRGWPLG